MAYWIALSAVVCGIVVVPSCDPYLEKVFGLILVIAGTTAYAFRLGREYEKTKAEQALWGKRAGGSE